MRDANRRDGIAAHCLPHFARPGLSFSRLSQRDVGAYSHAAFESLVC
jgi:hypothetical protein